jgi:hypothetical protein
VEAERGEAVNATSGSRSLQPPPQVQRRRIIMKKQPYTLIGAVIVATLFACSAAKAQTGFTLQANIPFDFSAGKQNLPAGEYTVTIMNRASGQNVLRFTSQDNRATAVLAMHSVQSKFKDGARLVFHRYGDKYILAQAWTGADNIGLEAPRSAAERASKIAGRTGEVQSVAMKATKN